MSTPRFGIIPVLLTGLALWQWQLARRRRRQRQSHSSRQQALQAAVWEGEGGALIGGGGQHDAGQWQ